MPRNCLSVPLQEKNQISQRALNPLPIKHVGWFVIPDHRVQPMVEAMDNLFVRLPKTGPCDRHNTLPRTMATILILIQIQDENVSVKVNLDIGQLMPKTRTLNP